MKKNIYLFFMLLLTLMVITKTPIYAHYDTAYWNEGKKAQVRSGWMDWLPNDRMLSELSLPGTHDTMAWRADLFGLDIARTQTMTLEDQLISGIRVIDIRAKYDNGKKFPIYHGITDLKVDFEEVLSTIKDFLKKNPTEFILMRFSQENSSASNREMAELFLSYYSKYQEIFFKGDFYNPTVGEMRGKLVLLSNVISLNGYGINYKSLVTQDDYYLATNWDLYSKWEKIKNHLNRTDNIYFDNVYMNYLTASGGVFPYFVASGHASPQTNAARLATGLTEPGFWYKYPDFPRGNWFGVIATIYFEGTNTLTANFLNDNKIRRSGIIMADFPGERLINAIIECNLRYGK